MNKGMSPQYDVFVSYASEDRDDFVQPLFDALQQRGLSAWIDFGQIKLGDSIHQKIDDGLANSRFGAVALSPHSLEKFWPKLEWNALLALEDVTGNKRVLPILHDLSHAELTMKSPTLGGRLSAASLEGIDSVVDKIADAVEGADPVPSNQATNLYGVPRQQPGFIGREEDLKRVREAVLRGDTTVSASISGLAGIGKTALATELAHRLAEEGEFPGGIFWLDAEQPNLESLWAGEEIGGQLAAAVPPVDRALETVRRISSMKVDVLVILDNVSSWTSNSRAAPLPQGRHSHLLLTTRESNLGGQDFEQVALDILPKKDAKKLLLKTAGRGIEPGVDDLLEALEGHALAIELAGAYLSEEGTAADYLTKLDRTSAEVEAIGRVRYERTTTMALNAIWERLDTDGRMAWCRAACFEPVSVGFALSDEVGVDNTARRTLRRFHLISHQENVEEKSRWKMHRLVREYGLLQTPKILRKGALQSYDDGCVRFAGSFDATTGFQTYLPEQLHLDAVLKRKLNPPLEVENSGFVMQIARARDSAGDFPGARELYEKVFKVRREELGEEHPQTLTSMNNLAQTLKAQGEVENARALVGDALAIARRTLPGAAPIRRALENWAVQWDKESAQ